MNRSVKELLRDYSEAAAPARSPQTSTSRSRAALPKSSDRPCFDSFVMATSDPFRQNWERIGQSRLNGAELAGILGRIHRATPGKSTDPLHAEHRQVIADHWHLWENPMRGKLSDLSAGQLADVLGDIAGLRILPSEKFLQYWFVAAEQKMGGFDAAHLTKSLYACAVLRKPPPYSLLASWYAQSLTPEVHFNPSKASKAAWAAAALHSKTNTPLYELIFNHVKARATDLSSSKECDFSQKQIHDAALWFEGVSPLPNIQRTETKSRFEKDMTTRLRNLGFTIDTHAHPIPVLKQAIDFSLLSRGKWVSFEIDGPMHFLHSTQTGFFVNDGRTLFRTALCRKMAPNQIIVRLPFDIVDHWMAGAAKDQHVMMNYILDEARSMGPGAYKVKFVNDEMVVDPMLHETSPRFLASLNERAGERPAPFFA